MDQLTDQVRQESPRTTIFVEDILICSENWDLVEENLERWRYAPERSEIKVSHSKIDHMCL